jgi:hypothetical protein
VASHRRHARASRKSSGSFVAFTRDDSPVALAVKAGTAAGRPKAAPRNRTGPGYFRTWRLCLPDVHPSVDRWEPAPPMLRSRTAHRWARCPGTAHAPNPPLGPVNGLSGTYGRSTHRRLTCRRRST